MSGIKGVQIVELIWGMRVVVTVVGVVSDIKRGGGVLQRSYQGVHRKRPYF